MPPRPPASALDREEREAIRELRERLGGCARKLVRDSKKMVRELRCELAAIDRAIRELERLHRKKEA